MPRSAAKSRAENQSRRSVQVNTPPTEELKVDDIIPVVLTHVQWTEMLIQEDSDEAVGEIMEELLSEVMEGCFKVYIKRQITPFSVSWAKGYLTQIVERQILCPDEGGVPEKTSKTEDSEPTPPPSDPWVKGCVPIVMTSPRHRTASQQDDDIVQVPAQAEAGVNRQRDIKVPTKRSPKQSEKQTTLLSYNCQEVLSPLPLTKMNPKKKQRIHLPPIPNPLPGKVLPSCSAEKNNVDLYKHTTGSLYQLKSNQPIEKLDYSCLPRQSIVPQYEIVDEKLTKPDSKRRRGLSTLKPGYNKQTEWTVASLKQLTRSANQLSTFQKGNDADIWQNKFPPSAHRKDCMVSSGSLRLNTMVLAKGVSLLDSQAVEMNPLNCNSTEPTKLRPIQSNVAKPLFSVNQVTSGPPPQVTPLCVRDK
ncbi:uncharacterized protein C2orf81 homolog isoform 1-T2 [Spinachia spinachia]